MKEIPYLHVIAHGRPAPQGSKRLGAGGAMREASPYLPAWRRALAKAIRERYAELGITMEMLRDRPVFVGPVAFEAIFAMPAGQRIDSPPDLDKLLRAVWDVCTANRVWEDDGRVLGIRRLVKRPESETCPTGVEFVVEPVLEARAGVIW